GRRIRRPAKTRSRKAARDIESAYRIKLAKGEVGLEEPKRVPTFAAALKEFLVWSEHQHGAPEHTLPLRSKQQGVEAILWRDATGSHHARDDREVQNRARAKEERLHWPSLKACDNQSRTGLLEDSLQSLRRYRSEESGSQGQVSCRGQ